MQLWGKSEWVFQLYFTLFVVWKTGVGHGWNLRSQQACVKLNLLEDPICFQFARTTRDLGILLSPWCILYEYLVCMPSICQCCHVFFLIIHEIKVANRRMCVCVLGAVLRLPLALFAQGCCRQQCWRWGVCARPRVHSTSGCFWKSSLPWDDTSSLYPQRV